MRMQRMVSLVLLLGVVGMSAGCGLSHKFIRKRKAEKKIEPIFALQKEYHPEHPPDVRYQAHFAYWKAAHDDLIEALSSGTRKRRLYSAQQAVKELRSLQGLLEAPQAEGLGALIHQMEVLAPQVSDPLMDAQRLAMLRTPLESLRRHLDKDYALRKMKAHLKPELPASPETPIVTDRAATH